MSYNDFATTFSNSRKNLAWPELDYIIEDIEKQWYESILDVGCGNGRFLEYSDKGESSEKSGFRYLGIDSSTGMVEEAQKLHPEYEFWIVDMTAIWNAEILKHKSFDAIILLASFHHLETEEERVLVLWALKNFLSSWWRVYMTNWNLRDQSKYETSYRGNGEFNIKIGAFYRYYHGFELDELEKLFVCTNWNIVENKIFDGERNIISILKAGE